MRLFAGPAGQIAVRLLTLRIMLDARCENPRRRHANRDKYQCRNQRGCEIVIPHKPSLDATDRLETQDGSNLLPSLILYVSATRAELVRRKILPHRPAIGVKLRVVCVSEAQISRILVVVGVVEGRRIRCLRRSDIRRRQYHSRCENSGDLASHIVLHCLPALGSGRMGPNLHPSVVKMCGIDAFGIAEIAKGLFGWAIQS
jgi:hypothetical protein